MFYFTATNSVRLLQTILSQSTKKSRNNFPQNTKTREGGSLDKKIVLYASNLSQRGSLACPEVGHVFNWVQTTTKFKKIIPYKSLYNEKTFLFYGIEMMIERADQGFLFGSSLLTSEPPPLEKRTGKTSIEFCSFLLLLVCLILGYLGNQ